MDRWGRAGEKNSWTMTIAVGRHSVKDTGQIQAMLVQLLPVPDNFPLAYKMRNLEKA